MRIFNDLAQFRHDRRPVSPPWAAAGETGLRGGSNPNAGGGGGAGPGAATPHGWGSAGGDHHHAGGGGAAAPGGGALFNNFQPPREAEKSCSALCF
ncbi:hypothetical protein CEE74_11860, partial [Lactobacillus crispatus]